MNTIRNNPKGIRNRDNIKYFCRASGSSSGVSKQKWVIDAFIEKYSSYLSPMNETNTIMETKSGTISPSKRFLRKLKKGEPLCMSNLDRALKTKSLEEVISFRRSLLSLKIQVLLANTKEYRGLLELRALISKKEKVLPRYIQFVSHRMNETLSEINASNSSKSKSKSINKERKGIRDYCIKYLPLIKSAFDEVTISSPDLRLWIIACFSGHLINQYLKDHYIADPSTRTPKFHMKELLVLRAIKNNHPQMSREEIYGYSNKYNKDYDPDKLSSYIIDLTPDKITKYKKSNPYRMLRKYEDGNFETGIKEIYSRLESPKYKLSWKGLSKAEIRKIVKHFPKIKGLRKWQLKTIKHVNHGHHVVLQVMAGGGKSLTFQLPALMGKMVVVVVPYKTLISNHDKSNKDIIPTAFINSNVSAGERRRILKRIENGEISLLFLTPEQLDTKKVNHAWKTIKALKGRVDLLVLDEAHHPKTDDPDFRAAYDPSYLNKAWKKLRKPQCLFLSASLRKESYQAIKRIIRDKKPRKLKTVRGPLEKSNVGLIKRNFKGPKAETEKIIWTLLMVRYLKKMGIRKIIIYTNTPRKVVYMMKQLFYDDNRNVYGVHGRKEGVEIYIYYEDGKKKAKILLTPSEIKKGQEDFENGKTGVLSANSAYAEGIDSDAGAIIVLDLPVNIEALYQEVLRCGHQGQKGLAFICVDDKADNFNKMALLKGDRDKMEQYDKDYEFLREDAENLWEGLTKPFLKRS